MFSPSGQGAGQTFGQQGVYNNMSITVSMAGGSGGAGSLPPMAQAVGNSNLSSVIPVCSDQQVSEPEAAQSSTHLILIVRRGCASVFALLVRFPITACT